MERYSTVVRPLSGMREGIAISYYKNVIIFIIRVLKLLLMNCRFTLLVVLLIGMIALPASATLTKVTTGSPVFIGETGLDISSGLLGGRQIAWWPAGNDTSTPPGKVLEITGDIHAYNITPSDFSGFEGKWYTWDKKPSVLVFVIKKPEFTLRIWDLDHDSDVTGQTIPQSTRVTYRIDTNLYPVFNKLNRPDVTSLDLFFNVGLKSPSGKDILSIYTGSAGNKDTLILPLDNKPFVKTSPYFWRDGGEWNHTARGGNGDILYPSGTYIFSASQNLSNMRIYYGDKEGVTISGPQRITFISDQPTVQPALTVTTINTAPTAAPTTPETKVSTGTTAAIPTKKPTWTSTPLPIEISILAFVVVSLHLILHRRNEH
jgi:hypothetical protein